MTIDQPPTLTMKPTLTLLLLIAQFPALSAQDAGELKRELLEKRDDADVEVVNRLADLGTRPALQGLIEAYDLMQSIYMRRAILRGLAKFDRVSGLELDALGEIMDVATLSSERIMRMIAVEVLAGCEHRGKTFLALIVDSAADDEVRELALEAHVGLGDASDREWYERLFRTQPLGPAKVKLKEGEAKRAHPLPRLREIAFDAIAGVLELDEVLRATGDANEVVRRRALEELESRDNAAAVKLAEEMYASHTAPPADRLAAARILYRTEGFKIAKTFLKDAVKNDPQEEFAFGLADLLAEMDDEGVRKELLKQAGKGKGQALVFSMRAARNLTDPKLDKALIKVLEGKELDASLEAMKFLRERRSREALESLEEIVAKPKDPFHTALAIETIGVIRGMDREWLERLAGMPESENVDVRNGAIRALAATKDEKWMPMLLQALEHSSWSTRLAAAEGLEVMRRKEGVGALVQRMRQETGRVAIEMGEILFRLTAKPFGTTAGLWADWWANEQDRFELVSEADLRKLQAEAETRKLKQVTTSEFFGIKIESHRVVFILDVSGSMSESTRGSYVGANGVPRMDVAKSELIKALEALDPRSFFNIVVFSGGVSSWSDELAELTQETLEDAKTFVTRLGANGGTNLFGALKLAMSDPNVDTVYVLSDGEPSAGDVTDPSAIRRIIGEWNARRGLVFHCIAVGENLRVLEWIAEDSGGTYVRFP